MALSRIKTWVSEVLTSTDLNAEFNNILNNALSLISPLTGNLAVGGNDITGIDELALDNAGSDASAAGRIRRNAQALTWHDGNAARTLPIVLDRDVTVTEVVNTVVETTVYSFSVPANTLLSNRILRVTMLGDYRNNSGGSETYTVRVKFGSTTVASFGTSTNGFVGIASDTTRRPNRIVTCISALNATNAQIAFSEGNLGAVAAAGVSAGGTIDVCGHTSVAEDTTSAKTLAITIQHATASANISAKCYVVQTELL